MSHTIVPSALSYSCYEKCSHKSKKIPHAGFELRIKGLSTNKKCSNLISNHGPKVSKSGALPTVQWIAVVNGCLDRYRCILRTRVKKLQLLETIKNKLCHARRHSYHIKQVQNRSMQPWLRIRPHKMCGRTDGQTAFQLYIVDR